MTKAYETILVEQDERVGTITLNRPKALNALNSQVMDEVTTAAAEFDNDPGIGAIIITGSAKAFAAGADIKEMSSLEFSDVFAADFFAPWAKLAAVRTPTIAAVAGYALGGGCELAMMCDVLIAADTAKFGQPEIKLGVLPGMGGSQRLTRAIGKAKAMDLILTGRNMDAEEAERSGLVARVVPADDLLTEARASLPPRIRAWLASSRASWRSGQVLFVHAGVNPEVELETFLAAPWNIPLATLDEDRHWAWVRRPFLDHRPGPDGFSGFFVVHGHTPNDARREASHADQVAGFRLNLDAGSAMTGVAKMAIIRDRYAEVVSARGATKREL